MELLNGTYVEVEVATGAIDSINKDFFVSEEYLKALIFYNGVLYQPDNQYFGYTTFPGTKKVTIDFVADPGDCIMVFFVTQRAPSELIKGDFPSIVAELISRPGVSLSSLFPGIGVTNVKPGTDAGNLKPSIEAGNFKPVTFVSGG